MSESGQSSSLVIDAVCNLFTPEVVSTRPGWSRKFHLEKIGQDQRYIDGFSVQGHVDMLDEAAVDMAFLLAPKMGREGMPTSWKIDVQQVINAVEAHPDRFRAIAGLNPHDGVAGTRELERLVNEYGFIGAHVYPHWFELAPDHRLYYPFYAKCVELDIPIQVHIGHCLRYTADRPLPSVGRPITLDQVACDFPDLKLIGIHLGWPWTEEMISVAYKHPNVYVATDAYAPAYWDPKFVHFINTFGQDKGIFGTDFPVITPQRARKEIDDLDLRPHAAAKFLGDNAAKLYNITT